MRPGTHSLKNKSYYRYLFVIMIFGIKLNVNAVAQNVIIDDPKGSLYQQNIHGLKNISYLGLGPYAGDGSIKFEILYDYTHKNYTDRKSEYLLPTTMGAYYPLGKYYFGVGNDFEYDSKRDTSQVPAKVKNLKTLKFNLSAARELFDSENSNLKLGFKYIVKRLAMEVSLFELSKFEEDGWLFDSWIINMQYKFKQLYFNSHFEKGNSKSLSILFENDNPAENEYYNVQHFAPSKYSLGSKINFTKTVSGILNTKYVLWSSNKLLGKNSIEYLGILQKNFTKEIKGGVGVYKTSWYNSSKIIIDWEGFSFSPKEELSDLTYLNLSLLWNLNKTFIYVEVSDNNLIQKSRITKSRTSFNVSVLFEI